MKKQFLILMMSLMALTVMAEKTTKDVTFNVPMHCQNCVNKVEKNIAFEKGVKDISCDLEANTVTVTYIAEKTDIKSLKEGFAKIGYKDVTVAGEGGCKSKECDTKCSKEAKKEACSDKKGDCKTADKKCSDKKEACCKK